MASIADVWISVLPDTSKIAPKIKEALRATERELRGINVDVDADTTKADEKVRRSKDKAKEPVVSQLEIDLKQAEDKLRQMRIREQAKKLGVSIDVDADSTKAAMQLRLVSAQAQSQKIELEANADTSLAATELAKFRAEQERRKIRQKIELDESGFTERLKLIGQEFSGVGGKFSGAIMPNLALTGVGLLPAAATVITEVAGALQQLAGAGAVVPGVFAGIASSVGVAKLSMQGMSDAYDAVTKAADGTQASVDAANKALEELSPNAAEAVKTVVGLKGTFTDLRNIGSQNLFAGVSDGLKGLVGNLLPSVTRGVDGISRSLNGNLLTAMTSLGSQSSQGFLTRIFGNTAEAQSLLSTAIDPIIHAFGTLAAAGSDALPRLATAVGKVADRFNAFITGADADGRLSKWINEGLDGFTSLGNIVLNLGKSFTGITEAAGGGAGLLSTLEQATQKMSAFLNSDAGQAKLKQFFADGRNMLGQLRDVAAQVGPILSGIFQAGTNAANIWLPVIRKVLETINSIPGGAAAVVQAFVAWKTISGIASVATGLKSIADLLKIALPAAAAEGATGITAAFGGLFAAGGIFAKMAPFLKFGGAIGIGIGGQLPEIAPGGGYSDTEKIQLMRDHPEFSDPAKMQQWIDAHPKGVNTGVNQNHPLGVPTLPQGPTVWGLRPPPGSSQSGPLGSTPSGVGSSFNIMPALATPAVSTYSPPVVTEAPSGTPNLPYAGTASPYGGMYPGDAALLSSFPTQGKYDASGDLAKGLGDCSSAIEDLINIMDGRSTAGRNMSTGNEAEWLTAHGFVQGMGGPGDFRVGFNSSHTQATLPDGTPFNYGSSAAAARGGVGGTGADDKAFTSHFYRPVSGSSAESMYPGMDGAGTGLTSQDLSLRNAQQRVNDTQHSEEQAQGRLNELRAKGTATDRQMEAAEYALAKAKREHQDAIDGLTVATDKYNKAQAKGKDANGDVSSLGGDLFGGVLEAIGLDGSLFKNPFQSGMWKGVTGVANFAGALGQAKAGQDTGSMVPGGAGGGGLFSGLMGLAQGLMPGMPGAATNPNSPNVLDAAQFKPPGVAGPGNAPGGPTINLQGASFGDSHGELQQQITNISSSMPRWPALAQNLPQP